MQNQILVNRDTKQWQKRLMYINMVFILVLLLAEAVMYHYLTSIGQVWCTFEEYVAFYILLPFLMNIMTWFSGWIFLELKTFPEQYKYMTPLVCLSLICFSVAYFHYIFLVLFSIFCVPIILSGMFGSWKMTSYIGVLNLALYLAAVYFPKPSQPPREGLFFSNVVIGVILLFMAYLLTNVVIDYHKRVMEYLQDNYEKQAKLQKKLMVDVQTGLLNHYAYTVLIQESINRYQKEGNPFTMAMIDVDNFKRINDTYGHGNGDLVLENLAGLIQDRLKNYPAHACRYGGEEFVILFDGLSLKESREIMERLRKDFSRMEQELDGTVCQVTFSCGIQEMHGEIQSERQLFEEVDKALYHAKRGGKTGAAARRGRLETYGCSGVNWAGRA
ncbi:MAG: diguanylate cyclase [Eubacteriales bacterium]|nr:diguanylate cyclase [Eubacteriales bacterium]